MELPRGITGFRHLGDPPLPVCDVPAFRGHCYAAARTLGGCVTGVEDPSSRIEINFACALLEWPTGGVAVLLNAHIPVVAFAEPPAKGDARMRFIDALGLAKAFRDFGMYDVVGVSELAARLAAEHCHRLSPAEREQIKYWQPRRVGEVNVQRLGLRFYPRHAENCTAMHDMNPYAFSNQSSISMTLRYLIGALILLAIPFGIYFNVGSRSFDFGAPTPLTVKDVPNQNRAAETNDIPDAA